VIVLNKMSQAGSEPLLDLKFLKGGERRKETNVIGSRSELRQQTVRGSFFNRSAEAFFTTKFARHGQKREGRCPAAWCEEVVGPPHLEGLDGIRLGGRT